MTYNEALTYIHSICWKGSKLGLERTQELLQKLGMPVEPDDSAEELEDDWDY